MTGITFSHMWAPGSSSAFPEARGRSPGELWELPRGHFEPNFDSLRILWDHFWITFREASCPGGVRSVATFIILYKSIAATPKTDRLRRSAHGRRSSLENKNIGPPPISQPLTRTFHGTHLGGAALPGVGGRGRRPFQSADPGGASACGASRNR